MIDIILVRAYNTRGVYIVPVLNTHSHILLCMYSYIIICFRYMFVGGTNFGYTSGILFYDIYIIYLV